MNDAETVRKMLPEAGETELAIDCDHSDGLYREGETVQFRIRAKRDGKTVPAEELECVLFDEKNQKAVMTPERDAGGAYVIRCRGRKGSILQAGVKWKRSGSDYVWSGVAVEHEKVRAAHAVPPDFDSFWEKYAAPVRDSKFTVTYRDLDEKLLAGCRGLIGKDVTVRSECGLTATGYLAYPENSGEKSLPILATFLGASKVEADIAPARDAAKMKTLAFNLNFHGLPNQITEEERNARRKALSAYPYENADNPDRYPLKDVFLRVLLTLKFLKTLPQWDGKEVMVKGGSLGGCQALVAAALDPQVTLCVAGAAAMSGHTHVPPGWPLLLSHVPGAEKFAPYFDSASFATRIKAETVMAVGLIDRTCHPSSTLCSYYNLPEETPKHLFLVLKGDHEGYSPDGKGVYWYGTEEIRQKIARSR